MTDNDFRPFGGVHLERSRKAQGGKVVGPVRFTAQELCPEARTNARYVFPSRSEESKIPALKSTFESANHLNRAWVDLSLGWYDTQRI